MHLLLKKGTTDPLTSQGGPQAEPRPVYATCEQLVQQVRHLLHRFVMLSQQQKEGCVANQNA